MKNLIVIDDFYKDAYAVRNYALQRAEYLAPENLPAEFPGTESRRGFFSLDVIKRIELAIGEKVIVNPARFALGVFAKTYARDARPRVVHVDDSDWTGVLYLTKPEDTQGGTTFHKDRETGLDRVPEPPTLEKMGFNSKKDFVDRFLKPKSKNQDNWDVSAKVGMKFNRMVLFRSGQMFHSVESYFGTDDENCRLTQLFFFQTEKL